MAIGLDDIRNAAVGAAVLAEAKSDPTFNGKLKRILEKRISDATSRDLLGLDDEAGDHMETGD